jgi:hypothetical protein
VVGIVGTVALATLVSCVGDIGLNPLPADEGLIPTYLVFEADSADWPTDPLQITRTAMRGDILEIDVEYAGGCRAHKYAFVVSTSFTEADPARTISLLAHDANDEPCEALVHESLRADLAELKGKYLRVFQPDSGDVVIDIGGAWDVRYVF